MAGLCLKLRPQQEVTLTCGGEEVRVIVDRTMPREVCLRVVAPRDVRIVRGPVPGAEVEPPAALAVG